MDINMPELGGYEATGLIRELSGTASLPIVALTAYTSERETALAAGMNDYVCKPIERDALCEVLDRWLKLGEPERSMHDHQDAATAHLLDTEVLEILRKQIGEENLTAVLHQFRNEAETR